MNDEQHLLASAYLDGVVTDEERARAEADPEVMAAVERLREVRRALAAVEPPDRARRDAAINAALGLFDSEAPAAAPPPPVTSLAARRSARWLMPAAAAAAVVIIAGGILATRNGDDDGGGDDSAAVATTVEDGARVDAAEEDQSAADTAPAATGDTRSAGEGGAAATTSPAAGTFAAAADTTGAPEATALAASLVVLTSPEELTEFARGALFATEYAPPADVARRPCDEVRGEWLGPAIYVEDDEETPVEIFLVAADDEVRAVDTATCTVIVTAPAPAR
jgi:hypothetical protein